MQTSPEIDKITPAFLAAQKAMKPAVKDAENPHFKSKYADLAAVWDAFRDAFHSSKIAVLQDARTTESGEVGVTTTLLHESGQWFSFGPLVIPTAKKDAHGTGSAISYGKRYALAAAVGVVTEDDDGNAAVEQPKPARARRAPDYSEGAFIIALRNAVTNGFVRRDRVVSEDGHAISREKMRKFLENLMKVDVPSTDGWDAGDWKLAMNALVRWNDKDGSATEYTT